MARKDARQRLVSAPAAVDRPRRRGPPPMPKSAPARVAAAASGERRPTPAAATTGAVRRGAGSTPSHGAVRGPPRAGGGRDQAAARAEDRPGPPVRSSAGTCANPAEGPRTDAIGRPPTACARRSPTSSPMPMTIGRRGAGDGPLRRNRALGPEALSGVPPSPSSWTTAPERAGSSARTSGPRPGGERLFRHDATRLGAAVGRPSARLRPALRPQPPARPSPPAPPAGAAPDALIVVGEKDAPVAPRNRSSAAARRDAACSRLCGTPGGGWRLGRCGEQRGESAVTSRLRGRIWRKRLQTGEGEGGGGEGCFAGRLLRRRPLSHGTILCDGSDGASGGWPSNPKPGDVARTPSGNNRG